MESLLRESPLVRPVITPVPKSPASCGKCVIGELGVADLCEVDRMKVTNTYRKGQVIFYEGNHSLGVHCVKSGRIKIIKSAPNGRQQIVRLAFKGDLVGYRSLLTSQPYSFTAEAMQDSQICFIGKYIFLSMLEKNSKIASYLIRALTRELSEAEDRLFDLTHKSASARLAGLLLSLVRSQPRGSLSPDRLTLDLSREELADLIGTTPETVIRSFGYLRKQGCLSVTQREIVIKNPQWLQRLSEGT